jgi:hypothetical protein
MHDQPGASEQEQEQVPERLEEEQAKTAQGHENPEQIRDDDE